MSYDIVAATLSPAPKLAGTANVLYFIGEGWLIADEASHLNGTLTHLHDVKITGTMRSYPETTGALRAAANLTGLRYTSHRLLGSLTHLHNVVGSAALVQKPVMTGTGLADASVSGSGSMVGSIKLLGDGVHGVSGYGSLIAKPIVVGGLGYRPADVAGRMVSVHRLNGQAAHGISGQGALTSVPLMNGWQNIDQFTLSHALVQRPLLLAIGSAGSGSGRVAGSGKLRQKPLFSGIGVH